MILDKIFTDDIRHTAGMSSEDLWTVIQDLRSAIRELRELVGITDPEVTL